MKKEINSKKINKNTLEIIHHFIGFANNFLQSIFKYLPVITLLTSILSFFLISINYDIGSLCFTPKCFENFLTFFDFPIKVFSAFLLIITLSIAITRLKLSQDQYSTILEQNNQTIYHNFKTEFKDFFTRFDEKEGFTKILDFKYLDFFKVLHPNIDKGNRELNEALLRWLHGLKDLELDQWKKGIKTDNLLYEKWVKPIEYIYRVKNEIDLDFKSKEFNKKVENYFDPSKADYKFIFDNKIENIVLDKSRRNGSYKNQTSIITRESDFHQYLNYTIQFINELSSILKHISTFNNLDVRIKKNIHSLEEFGILLQQHKNYFHNQYSYLLGIISVNVGNVLDQDKMKEKQTSINNLLSTQFKKYISILSFDDKQTLSLFFNHSNNFPVNNLIKIDSLDSNQVIKLFYQELNKSLNSE